MANGNPDKRYQELAEKWLNGSITPDEEQEFAQWYNKDQDALLEIPAAVAGSEEEHRRLLLAAIDRRRMPPLPSRRMSPRRIWIRAASAAAVLILLAGGSYWLITRPARSPAPVARVALKTDVPPGTTRATLTLDDGKQIVLDTAQQGLLATQGTATIKNAHGALLYQGGGDGSPDGPLRYNTLSTRNGEQFPLTLSDGSRLILDASTTIHYPVAFTGKDRTVEINGRAWFEVAKDPARPFYVVKGNQRVLVLGTQFDVNAYDNEPDLKVTLVAGKVQVLSGAAAGLLQPGQQAVVVKSKDHIQIIDHADVEAATAWKNGQIIFHGADAPAILREIERWYDVKVDIQGTLSKRSFFLEGSRRANLSELLRGLEVNHIHCRIDGEKRILTVTP